MNLKLFKICYMQDQIDSIDPSFTVWNNIENLNEQLREFPVFEQAHESLKNTDVDLWGLVSPKFEQKTNISGHQFISWIQKTHSLNPCNVYFINPVPIVESLFTSTIHHGENCHNGMEGILQRNLSLFNVSLNSMYMDCNTFSLCNYFVGDKYFWDKYINFVHSFLISINNNKSDYDLMYNTSAQYGPNTHLPFYTFVIERLFSIFLNINKETIKVSHYQYNKQALINKTGLPEPIIDELQALKDMKQIAISAGYFNMMHHWAFFRNRMAVQHPYLFLME
jgi:hypothetical protein